MKPRVVIINQYFVPDVASTGQLLDELARGLAKRGFQVRVLTAAPTYAPIESRVACPAREVRDGVEIVRMWTTKLSKDRAAGRILNSLTFFTQLFARLLFASRRDTVYLYATNPPFIGVVGAMVSLLRRHRYVVLLHDAYPQLAVWVGKFREGGLPDRVWEWLNGIVYRRARASIVLCEAAKRLVHDNYGVPPDRVTVIHNWADGEKLRPIPKSESRFAREHNLNDTFALMYSGNLGLYYEYETLLNAADLLKNDNFRLIFVGAGGRRAWLTEEIRTRGLSNTLMFGYRSATDLNDSLAAADALLVTIAKGIEGISFPSKLYSSLAVGRPVIAVSESTSELRSMLRDAGLWVEVGDAQGLAQAVRTLMSDKNLNQAMHANARALFEREYTVEKAVARYAEVLTKDGEQTTP